MNNFRAKRSLYQVSVA